MVSHTDGFFEGAADNGAGTAAMLGTAEYFAKMPKEKRRRTLYFVALLDHHSADRGSKWLHDNFQSVFAKTAMIVNSEHVAVLHSVLDRSIVKYCSGTQSRSPEPRACLDFQWSSRTRQPKSTAVHSCPQCMLCCLRFRLSIGEA